MHIYPVKRLNILVECLRVGSKKLYEYLMTMNDLHLERAHLLIKGDFYSSFSRELLHGLKKQT
jgi:hypothetical protein